jgi:hypothetical protein
MDEPKIILDNRRHPAAILLGVLLSGEPILVNGEERRYQDGIFGVRRQVFKGEARQADVLLGVDMSIAGFIQWCEKLPEEVFIQAVFNKVVKQELRRKQ